MGNSTHFSSDKLTRFANGRLGLVECELILEHLSQCDHCLEQMDALWSARPQNAAASLPPEIAQRLERAIHRRVQQQNKI